MKLKYKKGGTISHAIAGDAGFDIYANEDSEIKPMEQKWVSTGLFIEIPEGHVGIMKEKSGLAGKGIMLGAGVIDSNYRGEVKALVRNFSNHVIAIEKGQKIAQIVFMKAETPELVETEELTETERGHKGFGSTGLR